MNALIKLVTSQSLTNKALARNEGRSESVVQKKAVASDVMVTRGNWRAYKKAIAAPHATVEFKRDRCHEYLGLTIRAVPKHSMVFTTTFMASLAADNLLRRKTKFPYFARIASLYLEIASLESEAEQAREIDYNQE
jgi:hypothetical protein